MPKLSIYIRRNLGLCHGGLCRLASLPSVGRRRANWMFNRTDCLAAFEVVATR
jgi:hypothetical protein